MNILHYFNRLAKELFKSEMEWVRQIPKRPWNKDAIIYLLLLVCVALAFLSGYYHSILRIEGIL